MSVERVACPKCGSNNFATQARCWSCGTALTAGVASAPAPASSVAYNSPAPVGVAPPRIAQHSGLAAGAAAAMGLLMPAIAIPVGIVFLMLDDKRKAQIGWLNILWGTVGTVIHIMLTMALSAMVTPILIRMMTGAAGQARQGIEQRSGGLPQGFPGFPQQ
ncbi:MAG: hypothetical protein QM758_16045 [Armatimonas sp.]